MHVTLLVVVVVVVVVVVTFFFFFHLPRCWGECSLPFIPWLRFFFFFFFLSFFLKVEISSRTLIPLLMPGSVHSG